MSRPRYPTPTAEEVEAFMNDPNVTWEDVGEDEAPPALSEANATELLRQAHDHRSSRRTDLHHSGRDVSPAR